MGPPKPRAGHGTGVRLFDVFGDANRALAQDDGLHELTQLGVAVAQQGPVEDGRIACHAEVFPEQVALERATVTLEDRLGVSEGAQVQVDLPEVLVGSHAQPEVVERVGESHGALPRRHTSGQLGNLQEVQRQVREHRGEATLIAEGYDCRLGRLKMSEDPLDLA